MPDILTRIVPALSTSGREADPAQIAGDTNDTTTTTTSEDTTTSEGTTTDTTTNSSGEEEVVVEKKSKPKTGIEGRFSQVTAQRRAAEERAAALEARLETALKALENITATKSTTEKIAEEVEARPRRGDFDDPDAYDDALVEWSTNKATAKALAAVEKKQAERDIQQEKERLERDQKTQNEVKSAEFAKRQTAFMKDHEDFLEVAGEVNGTAVMVNAVLESEVGPAIVYYLGQNPEEAERISKLSTMRQIIEIGKIEDKVLNPPKPKVETTKVPTPPNPLRTGGGGSAAGKDLDSMTTEEYAAHRKQQIHDEYMARHFPHGKP